MKVLKAKLDKAKYAVHKTVYDELERTIENRAAQGNIDN